MKKECISPEEDALIESAVRISGCTKQDYIIKKLTDQSVVVQGNPKVYRGLKLEMRQILTELKRIGTGEDVSRDLLDRITSVMGGMKDAKDG